MTVARRCDPIELTGWMAVAAVVVWVSSLRLHLVASGPDPDFDAAMHAYIGRRMLSEWRDINIHWVWLPFWHALHAVVASMGGGLQTVRRFSVAASALSPFLLASTLQARARSMAAAGPTWLTDAERVIPFAAAILLAVWPGGIETGASGEPEAFFQCVVLGGCLLWERNVPVGAGLLFAFAAITRYEAWVLSPVLLALWWCGPRTRHAAWLWLIPSLAICGWIALHAWLRHEPFEFLRVNRGYVATAWIELHYADRHAVSILHPWRWYPLLVPRRSLGDSLWLCVPGAVWLVWRGPRALGSVSVTLLVFVTLVWVRRMNLGLPRHFAVIAPCYATAASAAVCVGASAVFHGLTTRARAFHPWTPVAIALAAGWMERRIAHWRTVPMVTVLEGIQASAWVSERQAAAVVRAHVTGDTRVFCDQPAVEVFSDLSPAHFIRWNVTGVAPYNFFVEAVQRGHALVVSTPERVTQLRVTSQTLFDDGHLVVLRRDAPTDIAPRLRALILTRPVAH